MDKMSISFKKSKKLKKFRKIERKKRSNFHEKRKKNLGAFYKPM